MYGKRLLRCFGVSTTRIAAVFILVLTVGIFSQPVLAQGIANGMDFQIVDSATGIGVGPAEIKWGRIGQTSVAPLSQSAVSSSEGKLLLQLPPGEYALEISAPGYKPMRTYDPVTSGSVLRENINLDPVVPAEEFRDSSANPELREGMELDHGFVSDALTRRPVAHVEVKLQQSGAAATTNSRGYFHLMTPAQDTSKLRSAEEFPPLDTLTASAPGYKTYVLTGILHIPKSWSRFRIELTPGQGITREDDTPVPLMPPGSQPKNQPPPSGHRPGPLPRFLLEWLAGHDAPVALEEQQSAPTTTPVTSAIILPPSIRVGSNCSNGKYGCTTTTKYALETYVQDGLGKEWSPSWDSNSLEAGAVAYRSVGAYYVANPLCSTTDSSCPVTYDICDNAACQVFSAAKPPNSTVAAAQATAGVALSSDGANVINAEYALHQDGGACPDGQLGDGTVNRPCMLDPVGVGTSLFYDGHGRGMSQWGSQWWAS